MNCSKCNSSWTSSSMVTKCPFCGADIAGEETQKPNIYDNSKEALAYIMQVHGADVLLGSMLKSYFNDYAPRVEISRKNVIFFVSSSGAGDILKRNMASDDMGHESAFRQAVQRVIDTYRIERPLVESVISEFTDALGWKVKIAQNSNTPEGAQQVHAQSAQIRYAENEQPSALKVGQRNVKFGRYNWRVLDVQSGKALLLSEDVIEKRPHHVQNEEVTWEKCTLRGYLNGEFLKTFSDAERGRIVESTVMNANNPWFGTNGGNVTRDKVFLLSLEEVVRYFGDSGALAGRKGNGISYHKWNMDEHKWYETEESSQAWCFMDQYSNERMATYNGEKWWWWLRSPGFYGDIDAGVDTRGAVSLIGFAVYDANGGVRPALWINLNGNNVSELTTAEMQQVQTRNVSRQVEMKNEKAPDLKIGQRNVKFGRYNWRVLDVQSGKALLLAEDVVEKRPYHVKKEVVTWEECTLREYLNGEFLKSFSNDEQNRIAMTTVRNEDNSRYGTNRGNDTKDRIFLLSVEEAKRYFGNDAERVAKYEGKTMWWWLRSPGYISYNAAFVIFDGAVDFFGFSVYNEDGGVRPALWINL